ncbi:MAG: acetate kinase [SAR324 cluster bacterium]|nr:acetate kinase [SAR324 cluster bacterium]MBF0350345.1 acetate kinase [SAR324 cluster bacterium]
MKILVINAGSSSVKYQLFNMENHQVMATGLVERIGEPHSSLKHQKYPKQPGASEITVEQAISDHKEAMELIGKLLTDPHSGVIKDALEIAGIGHRVVHGGEAFHDAMVMTDEALQAVRDHVPLAPLHNPANLTGIEVSISIFPGVPQVGVFDTAFHQSIPAHAYHYALPYEYYTKHRIRRYGFHGTSHYYVAKEAAKYLNKPLNDCNFITIHLGNGASMAAVERGKSVDTTMGMTPLEGLIMGTRCGDVDPALHVYIAENVGLTIQAIDKLMNKESGLKGICGSNDMRDILEKVRKGDKYAKLAFDMYTYRIKKYVGSYCAVLGDVDAIIFTAGIGQNSPDVREAVCSRLNNIGIIMDTAKNKQSCSSILELNTSESPVKILAIATNEELEIALQTHRVIAEG